MAKLRGGASNMGGKKKIARQGKIPGKLQVRQGVQRGGRGSDGVGEQGGKGKMHLEKQQLPGKLRKKKSESWKCTQSRAESTGGGQSKARS